MFGIPIIDLKKKNNEEYGIAPWARTPVEREILNSFSKTNLHRKYCITSFKKTMRECLELKVLEDG